MASCSTPRRRDLRRSPVQIRGGRGFKRRDPLREVGCGRERILRDMRINRIRSTARSTSFIAREAVDHGFFDPRSFNRRLPPERNSPRPLKRVPLRCLVSPRCLGWSRFPKFGEFGSLSGHMGYVERSARHLRDRLPRDDALQAARAQADGALPRVDIGTDLFAMSAAIATPRCSQEGGEERRRSCRRLLPRGADAHRGELHQPLHRHDAAATGSSRICSRANTTGSGDRSGRSSRPPAGGSGEAAKGTREKLAIRPTAIPPGRPSQTTCAPSVTNPIGTSIDPFSPPATGVRSIMSHSPCSTGAVSEHDQDRDGVAPGRGIKDLHGSPPIPPEDRGTHHRSPSVSKER